VESNGEETVPPVVDEVLRTPGQPLESTFRRLMEARFGHDFGQVRVHTGAAAAESARAVNASAYTVEGDVVFGAGQYAPASPAGRRLLAHELAHVVQQRRGSVAGQSGIGPADSALERDADRAADRLGHRPTTGNRLGESLYGGRTGVRIAEVEQGADDPDPDIELLFQTNGTTTCVFPAGTASMNVTNTACSSVCTSRHESKHVEDIGPCCAKAGEAYRAATTGADRAAARSSFFRWMSGHRDYFECRAYAISVSCADEQMTAKKCDAPAAGDVDCCNELKSYRDDKESRRVSHCAAGQALGACPWP
jgi:hypothetical protein